VPARVPSGPPGHAADGPLPVGVACRREQVERHHQRRASDKAVRQTRGRVPGEGYRFIPTFSNRGWACEESPSPQPRN
jgi:hypothetical protein